VRLTCAYSKLPTEPNRADGGQPLRRRFIASKCSGNDAVTYKTVIIYGLLLRRDYHAPG